MRILIVGSGGREHALAWRLSKDPDMTEIYAAPGNPGIAELGTCVPIDPNSTKELADFASREQIDFTVVGPEGPLEAGIVDTFEKRDLRIFGPDKKAARIETSKTFTKEICTRYKIPVPRWESFTDPAKAKRALDQMGPPWVVKADGLAAGKGTTITGDRHEAERAILREIKRETGRIVIEEFIDGWEASFTATSSGGRIQWLAPIFQDYKPIGDGDKGPNTGGMGVYSPVHTITPSLVEKIKRTILEPTVAAMAKENTPYQGVLYLNTIIKHGTEDPLLLEYNARFGDPEAQGIMLLVKRGLLHHMLAISEDAAKAPAPECASKASLVIVLASKGYPEKPSTGDLIKIKPPGDENVKLFHAGTSRTETGELVTAGGRVLNIAATGPNVESARRLAYSTMEKSIHFPGMQYRRDIGSGEIRHRNLEQIQT
jgi:phosphoribosylamine--glycine ligase